MTDRPIRPLFPKDFRNEVQVITTSLSADMEHPLDMLSIIGASASLSISQIPFNGPISATRVGYVDGSFVVNPTYEQMEASALELIVAGSRDGVLMMEAGAEEIDEDQMLEAIKLAQETNLEGVALQDELVGLAGKEKDDTYVRHGYPKELEPIVGSLVDGKMESAMSPEGTKQERQDRLDSLQDDVVAQLEEEWGKDDIKDALETYVDAEFRRRIVELGERPDGRSLTEIRPISAEAHVLPRPHGSGIFQRGETQILGVVTLGPIGDALKIDSLSPVESKRFMLHYNFPPYSTGETKRVGSPGRREIGHGMLAERAISAVLPDEDEFPYTIRVVAEALGSNGSTSMGSTCAGILALMDAGVPIKKPVAGISVGLVTNDDGDFVTLTDIQGMEDHFGDMDFKVAGTRDGITAIQLDIKVQNIGYEVIEQTLSQAKEARLRLLDIMAEAISEPRDEVSEFAPRMISIKVPVDKIGAVIGPGGKTIRGIQEETGANVDVQDDGTVFVSSVDGDSAKKAVETIELLTKEAKVGEIYTGKVVRIMPFGAFVGILPGKDGMVHISEIANYRVAEVEDELELGQEVTVQVIDVDPSGKIALSRRALLSGDDSSDGEGSDPRPQRSGNGRPPRGGDRPRGRGYSGPRGGGRGPRDRGPRPPRRD